MIKKLTFLLWFFTSFVFSQNLEFTVIVKDFDTDLPIDEVTITALRTRQGFLSNKEYISPCSSMILVFKSISLIRLAIAVTSSKMPSTSATLSTPKVFHYYNKRATYTIISVNKDIYSS